MGVRPLDGRAAFVADVHVGNHQSLGGRYTAGLNERCSMVLRALEDAVAAAIHDECAHFVIAGDLFDTVRPSPQMLAGVMAILREFPGQVHALLGNHDMVSTELRDNALAPLGELPNVRVWERPGMFAVGQHRVVMVPFQPGPANDWIRGEITNAVITESPSAHKGTRALCTHLGLRTQAMRDEGPWMKAAQDAVDVELLAEVCVQNKIVTAFAGNWHGIAEFEVKHGKKAVAMKQISSLCPTGWDNPGIEPYGWVHFWPPCDAGPDKVQVGGPRFVYRIPAAKSAAHKLFVRVKAPPSDLRLAVVQCESAVADGRIHAYVVEAEEAEVRQRAFTAAAQASSGGLANRAIDEHVEKMELPPGVERPAVAAEAKRFIAAAGGGA